jgi:hypothetical protein
MEILKLIIIILDSKQTQQANFKTFALELMLQVGGFRWECQKSLGQKTSIQSCTFQKKQNPFESSKN